jgi:hypothetical protein
VVVAATLHARARMVRGDHRRGSIVTGFVWHGDAVLRSGCIRWPRSEIARLTEGVITLVAGRIPAPRARPAQACRS